MEQELEQEFKTLTETVGKEIESKIQQARQLIIEAVDLAEKHGIPFYAYVSELGSPYIPETFENKYGVLDKELVEELTGVSSDDLENSPGWRFSSVC